MIVGGIDPHMRTHTAVAVDSVTGRGLGTRTVAGDGTGHDELLAWARSLGPERYFVCGGTVTTSRSVLICRLGYSIATCGSTGSKSPWRTCHAKAIFSVHKGETCLVVTVDHGTGPDLRWHVR